MCHLAGELVSALQKRQPDLDITDEDVLCEMIAGLCHDLGHGPYSHMWEEFVNTVNKEANWKVRSKSLIGCVNLALTVFLSLKQKFFNADRGTGTTVAIT